MALGVNQSIKLVGNLHLQLPSNSFLVIDEATEQYWPSHLHKLQAVNYNVIKIRSLTKGIGLNGLRCAYIAHSEELRAKMVETMDNFQGGMDYESLNMVVQLVQDPHLLKKLLYASHNQVQTLRRRAEGEIIPDKMILSKIANGYIGSIALKRLDQKKNFREFLLHYCSNHLCPVILGSSMLFAVDSRYEFVRLNYYNETHHLIQGLRILRGIYEV